MNNMEINKEQYQEENTDSLINIRIRPPLIAIWETDWNSNKQKEYWEKQGKRTSKQYLKDVFGRQQTCKNYTRRNWIWTFSDGNGKACLYALVSETGLHWEYRGGSDSVVLKQLVDSIEKEMMK
jgi:hypothetical protein